MGVTQSLSSNVIPSREDKAGCWVRTGSGLGRWAGVGKQCPEGAEMKEMGFLRQSISFEVSGHTNTLEMITWNKGKQSLFS